MSTTINIDLRRLPAALRKEEKRIVKSIRKALQVTAQKAVPIIRKHTPMAFGELRDSVMSSGIYGAGPNDAGSAPVTGVYAPHAGAVEQGSRPHKPDWERLLAWVKLRATQGLTPKGRLRNRFRKELGPTTPGQARSVASRFKAMEVRGRRNGPGRHLPVDAPEIVARFISKAIEEHGTRPHWYVKNSLPEIRALLDHEIEKRIWAREGLADPIPLVPTEPIPLVPTDPIPLVTTTGLHQLDAVRAGG